MTRQVSLAEDTYARLRQRRHPGESFSEAIDRLLDVEPKDPLGFARRIPSPPISTKEWLRQIQADRDASRVDA